MLAIQSLRALRSFLGHFVRDYQRYLMVAEWRSRAVGISPYAMLQLDRGSILSIGPGSTVGPFTLINLVRDPLATCGSRSELRIGARTAVNEFNNIRAGSSVVTIGSHCLISQFVSIIGINHTIDGLTVPIRDAPWDTAVTGVAIGDDVWIGSGAILLPGSRVGDGAVIAAGAVVTGEVPARAIVAGVPAAVRRYRRGPSGAESHGLEEEVDR